MQVPIRTRRSLNATASAAFSVAAASLLASAPWPPRRSAGGGRSSLCAPCASAILAQQNVHVPPSSAGHTQHPEVSVWLADFTCST